MTLYHSLVSKIIEGIDDVLRVRAPEEEASAPAPRETLFQAIKMVLTADEKAVDKEAVPDNGQRCGALRQLLDYLSPLDGFEEAVSQALHVAAEKGLLQEAQILLQHGSVVDTFKRDMDCSHSALTRAAMKGHSEMVKLLVQHGADIEHMYQYATPLMLACLSRKLECVRTLLELGANVRMTEYMGKTALFLVVEQLSPEDCLQFLPPLLQKGADPNTTSVLGESVEDSLCDYVKRRFVQEEEDEDWDFWDEERLRDLRTFVEMVSLLLRSGLSLCCYVEESASYCLLKLSLQHFPALLPLSTLLLDSGVSFCPQDHDCWSRYKVLYGALISSVVRHSEAGFGSSLKQAAALLELAKADQPLMHVAGPVPPLDYSGPHVAALRDFHSSVRAQELSAAPLQSLCRGVIRRALRPWPLETKVQALGLASALKDFLLLKEVLTSL